MVTKKKTKKKMTREEKIEHLLQHQYFADFETTTEANYLKYGSVRVYMWQVEDAYGNKKWRGTEIGDFMECIKKISKDRNFKLWFHNLKFDFSFIEWFLLYYKKAQYKSSTSMNKWTSWGKEYTTVKDGMGPLYGADWIVSKNSSIAFRDSAKIFPTSLKKLGGVVGIEKLDEKFDYHKVIGYDFEPSESDWQYMDNDVAILRKAMVMQIRETGEVRMTRTSYAFNDLKKTYVKENTPDDWKIIKEDLRMPNGKKLKKKETIFDYHFPNTEPELYKQMKGAYSGGKNYLRPDLRGKELGWMTVYDVNSEYPSVMLNRWFPIGAEEAFRGDYNKLESKVKKERPIFIQRFKAKFKIKEKGFPTLPKKYSLTDKPIYTHKDLKGSFGENNNSYLLLSSVDLEHFFKNYDVSEIEYFGGWHWKGVYAPFKTFVETQAKIKMEAKECGNKLLELLAKLSLNGCYGAFAKNPFKFSKGSYLGEDGVVKYSDEEEEPEARGYFPMAIFIAAYARDVLFDGMYKAGFDRVVYTDTDSIHVLGTEEVPGLELHKSKFGAWDKEKVSRKGKYLRDKCYALEIYNEKEDTYDLKITAAGLSDDAKAEIEDINYFELGRTYSGSLMNFQVMGGSLLREVDKELKQYSLSDGEYDYLMELEEKTLSV